MKKYQEKQYINNGTDEQMEIYGFSRSILGYIVTWIFIILTLGFLRLVFYWKPNWMLWCTHRKCTLEKATQLLLRDKYQQWYVEEVKILKKPNDWPGKDVDNECISINQESKQNQSTTPQPQPQQPSTPGGAAAAAGPPPSSKSKILVKNSIFKDTSTIEINEKDTFINSIADEQGRDIKFFLNKRWKYVWNETEKNYERLRGLEEDVALSFFPRCRGLTVEEQLEKQKLYGENSIRIHLTPIFVLFFREVLSPFYIFQVFSCALWFYDDYYYYASCIVLLSAVSIAYSLFTIRQNERALRDIIHHAGSVTVLRRSEHERKKYIEEEIPSENLVPGDVVCIKNMTIMQCDAVLLNGNVIVNESMLTGESVPVTKTALSSSRGASVSMNAEQMSKFLNEPKLNVKEHSRHIIFSGTQVIQTRFYENEKLRAVVLRTGFNTTKGELVRSILHPKPVDFRFNNDTYKYIGGLSVIALIGMAFSMTIKILRKNPLADIIKRSLDIITIAVPPALPGALTAGLIYAQNRLRRQNIFCISPRTINICGTINTFVFDKTGTLTEDGLDLKCVLPVERLGGKSPGESNQVNFQDEINDVGGFKLGSRMLEAMASCHSITRIHGELAGDPLDCKMFEFTKWELIEPNPEETENYDSLAPTIVRPVSNATTTSNGGKPDASMSDLIGNVNDIGIIKQFPFSSSLQRMSVVVRALNRNNFTLYCKGSPEKIAEMCKPDTLPRNFQAVLTMFTREGYRVIGVATRPVEFSLVKIRRMEREKLEENLEFLGLIVMENRLKPETCAVINKLKAANIRTIMCTGDNILTALSVARDCGMINEEDRVIIIEANPGEDPKFTYAELLKQKVREIEFDPKSKKIIKEDKNSHFHFAVGGKSFAVIRNEHKDLAEKLAVRGTVFGRMSPEQKQQLIEQLQDLGYSVGMCGDGANDCGALKAANSGISLSNAEASVASPFTSKNPNIECVPSTIKEGRAALVTSFGTVKFICMYSLTQFISVIILYTINGGLTDFEFLYIDLFLVTIVAFFFSRTESFPELYKKQPLNKLIAWRPICSVLGHMLIILAIQVFVFFQVKWQPWFEAYEDSDNKREKNFASYENTAVFTVSMFQYLGEAVIFSKGAPYRRSIFSNLLFISVLFVLTIFSLIVAIAPIESVYEFFTLKLIPDTKYRIILVAISIVHFFAAFIFESYIIDADFSLRSKDSSPHKASSLREEDRKCYPIKASNQMPYQKIEHQIRNDTDWPPISPATPATPATPNHINNTTTTTILPDTTTTPMPYNNYNNSKPEYTTPIVANNYNNNNNQFELRTYNEKHTPVNELLDAEFKMAVHRNRMANVSRQRNGSEKSDQLTSL